VTKVDVGAGLGAPPLPEVTFYEWPENRVAPIVLREATQIYSALALSTHETIWIKEEDFQKLRTYAENQIVNPKAIGSLPAEERMKTLRKSAMVVVEDLFTNPSPENINKSVKVVGSFVHVMMKDPKAYFLLTKLSSHDPYTLQHSVGTAVNSIILGKKLGITSEQDLNELGLAGLLHDIGKVKVKKEIINKDGPLDELEWEEMRQHSAEGYEIVKNNPTLSERTKRAILEHHEDRMGTGYPDGKKSEDCHLFSKIVCLADVFNALTTNRSYSKARSPLEAFQLMREKIAHKIDPELFKAMVLIYGGELEPTE
jgi:putative nucleotidyltransferase with HDIG domain